MCARGLDPYPVVSPSIPGKLPIGHTWGKERGTNLKFQVTGQYLGLRISLAEGGGRRR